MSRWIAALSIALAVPPSGSAGVEAGASEANVCLQERVAMLSELSHGQQLADLKELQQLGPESAFASNALLKIWENASGDTDDRLLAATLDVFRTMGPAGGAAAPDLARQLRHEARVYWGRDYLEVVRLRSYLMVTLGEIGLPVTAYPHLLDSLAHTDERVLALEVGSAARAARSVKEYDRRQFVGHLVRITGRSFADEEFSLSRYSVDFPVREVTTCQLEVIDTLAVICRSDDVQAVGLLERLSQLPVSSGWDRRVIDRAAKVLQEIQSRDTLSSQPDVSIP